MASVSFDSLPHNGAIITLRLLCGLTHRRAYKDVGVVSVVIPIIGLLVMLAVGSWGRRCDRPPVQAHTKPA